MTIIEKILLELSAKKEVEDGMPDFTNEKHLLALNEVLIDLDWSMKARSELLYTLMEAPKGNEDKYPANAVDSDKVVYFKSKEARDAAIKAGTHEKSSEKDPDDKSSDSSTSISGNGDEFDRFSKLNKSAADTDLAKTAKIQKKKALDKQKDKAKKKSDLVGTRARSKDWDGASSDEILDRISTAGAPEVRPISSDNEAVDRQEEQRKQVFEDGIAGKGGVNTTGQEEMANISRQLNTDDPEVILKHLCDTYDHSKLSASKTWCVDGASPGRKKKLISMAKASVSGQSTMKKLQDDSNGFDYGKQPTGYPINTTDNIMVRDLLITKLKEAEEAGDEEAIKHYKEELYFYQKKATDKSVDGREGDADTIMIYKDKQGRDRVAYITNKMSPADILSNSTIETTKQSIIENLDGNLSEEEVKSVLVVVDIQATKSKQFNKDYVDQISKIKDDEVDSIEEKNQDVLGKALSVNRGSAGRSIFAKPNTTEDKYRKEALMAPEVKAQLLNLPPAPNNDKTSKEYKTWKKSVLDKWGDKDGSEFSDGQVVMAAIRATGTGNLDTVGKDAKGAPYCVIKVTDVTSNLRLKVRKCLQNKGIDPENPPQDELKKCADGVSQEKDPKDKSNSLYGGSFTPDDIISIYNDKDLERVEKIGTTRGQAVGNMYDKTTQELVDRDKAWAQKNPKKAKEMGWVEEDNDNPPPLKVWVPGPNAENGPHVRSYIAGYMQRLHLDDYASGDVNGRVIAEMGASGYTPQQIAECLGDLTGYKKDSGISLQEHLMRNLKPSTDGQDIIYMDGDKEKIVGIDSYRTAGRGEKMAGQYGKDMVNCLKGKAN